MIKSFLTIIVILVFLSCSKNQSQNNDCTKIIDTMSICYPDLAVEGRCTEETIKRFEFHNLAELSCEQLKDPGKADILAIGGCDVNEHRCGLIFCCDDVDYLITSEPDESTWNFVSLVDNYQNQMDYSIYESIAKLSNSELMKAHSYTYQQRVELLDNTHEDLAVEFTTRLVDLPYETFIDQMEPADWGISLGGYVGGEVKVIDKDEQGRPIRQLERMVLNPLPNGMEIPPFNMDMTKTEIIEYAENSAIIYWYVYNSDNDTVNYDIGTVEFEQYGNGTLITFHSAHSVNLPGGMHITNDIAETMLNVTFTRFINHYADIVR